MAVNPKESVEGRSLSVDILNALGKHNRNKWKELDLPDTLEKIMVRGFSFEEQSELYRTIAQSEFAQLKVLNKKIFDVIQDSNHITPKKLRNYDTFASSITGNDRDTIILTSLMLSYGDQMTSADICPKCSTQNIFKIPVEYSFNAKYAESKEEANKYINSSDRVCIVNNEADNEKIYAEFRVPTLRDSDITAELLSVKDIEIPKLVQIVEWTRSFIYEVGDQTVVIDKFTKPTEFKLVLKSQDLMPCDIEKMHKALVNFKKKIGFEDKRVNLTCDVTCTNCKNKFEHVTYPIALFFRSIFSVGQDQDE